jgi:hypothetical protein
MTPTGTEFGFHGALNILDQVAPAELTNLFVGLEPGLLNRREHREILRAALGKGYWRLAQCIWRRMRDPEARRQ